MACLIKVSQPTQLQIRENGVVKAKTLMPNTKYVVCNVKNKQLSDLKIAKCILVKNASEKDESCFENIDLA